MPVREDIITSAVNFLQDPNVASSSVDSKVSFLRSKNLTQEEIDTALARAGSPGVATQVIAAPAQPQPQQPYYGQYQQPPPYGWQPPPPAPPRRDWRDWFIMATVVGGVSYGLYSVTKRYIYPLVAPPTPEKLEQDKATVDEQFEKAFATLDQLSKDTEALKVSEEERTEKLDKLITDLESFIRDTKSVSRRQEDETERLRDDMKALKDIVPKNMTANKDFTDGRLREIATEVKSLKALINQRMTAGSSSTPAPAAPSGSNNYLRPAVSAAPASPAAAPASPAPEPAAKENEANGDTPVQNTKQDYITSLGGRSSPFGSGMPMAGKPAIPSWQMAMANKNSGADAGNGSAQQEAGSSS
ncbi:peroxisomal membrane protein pex14 [Pestalotiopsis sp. IQ-011]